MHKGGEGPRDREVRFIPVGGVVLHDTSQAARSAAATPRRGRACDRAVATCSSSIGTPADGHWCNL
eukprot:366488-Chlamydomonas_euryale.AAC.7